MVQFLLSKSLQGVRRLGLSGHAGSWATSRALSSLAPGSQVAVIGMGLMGNGIVQLAADHAKYNVVAVDMGQEALDKGMKSIEKSLSKIYGKKCQSQGKSEGEAQAMVAEVMARITPTTDIKLVSNSSIVVEAIVENLEIKKKFYEDLGKICSPDTVFASNTSSFSIEHLSKASGRPDKVAGLHFFNPAVLMDLCEVVQTTDSSHETVQTCLDFAKQVNRKAVLCKDTPGFIVNRLLVPYIAQAMAMYDRGEASTKDIDTAMRNGAGYKMGPFVLADYVGLDTLLSILSGWKTNYPDEPAFVVPQCLIDLVGKGKFGRKSGEGFYKWENGVVVN